MLLPTTLKGESIPSPTPLQSTPLSFLEVASCMLPNEWIELKISSCRGYFRAFQIEVDNLGMKNFQVGTVVKKLQLFQVGRIFKNPNFFSKKSSDRGEGMDSPFKGSPGAGASRIRICRPSSRIYSHSPLVLGFLFLERVANVCFSILHGGW